MGTRTGYDASGPVVDFRRAWWEEIPRLIVTFAIGLMFAQEFLYDRHPQAYRVYVPGGYGKRHGNFREM